MLETAWILPIYVKRPEWAFFWSEKQVHMAAFKKGPIDALVLKVRPESGFTFGTGTQTQKSHFEQPFTSRDLGPQVWTFWQSLRHSVRLGASFLEALEGQSTLHSAQRGLGCQARLNLLEPFSTVLFWPKGC